MAQVPVCLSRTHVSFVPSPLYFSLFSLSTHSEAQPRRPRHVLGVLPLPLGALSRRHGQSVRQHATGDLAGIRGALSRHAALRATQPTATATATARASATATATTTTTTTTAHILVRT